MKNWMKMLMVVVLYGTQTFASPVPMNPRPTCLAVIVDASPTSEYKWGQIKLFAAGCVHALEAGDRLEIYSARKNSVVLHSSSAIKPGVNTTMLRCLDGIDRIFFLDKADIATSAENVFETFKISSQNFNCCLLIVSDGKMSNSQIRQLKRVLSAYKMRNWPVMFATFDDADKDIFRSGIKNEFAVTLIKDRGLEPWLNKVCTSSVQEQSPDNNPSKPVDTLISKAELPETPIKNVEIKKDESIVPASVESTGIAGENKNIKSTENINTSPVKSGQLTTDTVTDIELKNQQTLTAKIKSIRTPSPATPPQDPNNSKPVDVNTIKAVSKKPDANSVPGQKPESKESKPVVKAKDADQSSPKAPTQVKRTLYKKLIMAVFLLPLLAFIAYYVWQKMIAAGSGGPFLTDESQNGTDLKLMAAYNGVEYELGSIDTISNLEIGSHPGSTIPVDIDETDQKLFAIKSKNGSLTIKNLSNDMLTVSALPLAPNKKALLILPADIRFGETVTIQLYQLSQEDQDLQQS